MQRVAVVGSGGAGKTTFARELGRRTGLPVVHLDRLFWKPGWVETSRAQWSAVQGRLVAEERWIIDGNYGGTFDIRFARADTVIVLALPRLTCVARAVMRSLRNHGRSVQAENCPERLDPAFLRWIWRYGTDSRPRLDDALARHRGHLQVIELTSRRAVRRYLDELGP